jgi:NAD(P)-dependent dehydrogenase (short-subunit alcohol dehydrogenase family)
MGRSTARALTDAGALVTLADVNDDALAAAEKELLDAGHRVLAVHCDVADGAQVAVTVATTVEAVISHQRHQPARRVEHDDA